MGIAKRVAVIGAGPAGAITIDALAQEKAFDVIRVFETFKIFEWQAVLAARILAGRAKLPSIEEQKRWEDDRLAKRGNGAKFALVFPDFEEYFETVRELAGPANGRGRELPPFNKFWFERFMAGHERRKEMWRRLNAEARETLEQGKSEVRAKL